MKMKVAEAIAKIFKQYGIEYLFLLTGGNQELFLALQNHGINMILARNEKSAAYIADGYSRASSKFSAVYGKKGPGAANLAAGLADPYWAMSPLLAITGANDASSRYKYDYQELEQQPLFEPVTYWNKLVTKPDRIIDLFRRAIQNLANSNGPVHLDIPTSYFSEEIEVDEKQLRGNRITPVYLGNKPIPQLLEKGLDLINQSQKPLILAGSGCVKSGAEAELLNLAEKLRIPVVTSLGGKGIISEQHPLAIGVAGKYSRKVANDILSEADCLLVIGSRLGGLVTNGYTLPTPETKIIRMDIDPNTFNVTYKEDISILCDAKESLSEMLKLMSESKGYTKHSTWSKEASQRVEKWERDVKKEAKTPQGNPLRPQTVISLLNSFNEKISVVADTGYAAAWSGVFYIAKEPRSYFRANGSLGWSFPASLGVQLAQPDRKVICVTGDGGFGYHISEIETAIRYQIPVTVLVLNNSSLAFNYHIFKHLFNNQTVSAVTDFGDANYAQVAKALGARAMRVATESELETALRKAIKSEDIMLIDVVIDKEQVGPVTTYENVRERKV